MRRKAKRKALIPKTWTAKDGIDRLPNKTRLKVVEALSRIRMGEPPEPNFFYRKYSRVERERIAYELEKSSVSVQDIATLLGMSMWGVVVMLGRVRQQQAFGLGPDWASAIFVNEINNQIIDAAWNRARSEATDDEEMAARFRQQATLASKAINDQILKGQESEAISRAFREAAATSSETEDDAEPDPINRVDYIDWVYRNKIAKQLQSSEDADIIDQS
jgi:hypothetical protein